MMITEIKKYNIPEINAEDKKEISRLIDIGNQKVIQSYLQKQYLTYTYETLEKTYSLVEIEKRIIFHLDYENISIQDLQEKIQNFDQHYISILTKMDISLISCLKNEVKNITNQVIDQFNDYLKEIGIKPFLTNPVK